MFGVKVFLCVACLVAIASAYPAGEESEIDFEVQNHKLDEVDTIVEVINSENKIRVKRVTCDLLSFGGKVNHSACAAHCIFIGFRGGWCNSQAVCNCRR